MERRSWALNWDRFVGDEECELSHIELFLSQDDLRNQAQKLKQHLTDTEAEKSQVQTELRDLQRQLSQNQEGEKLKAGTGIWREERKGGKPRRGRNRPSSHSTACPQL